MDNTKMLHHEMESMIDSIVGDNVQEGIDFAKEIKEGLRLEHSEKVRYLESDKTKSKMVKLIYSFLATAFSKVKHSDLGDTDFGKRLASELEDYNVDKGFSDEFDMELSILAMALYEVIVAMVRNSNPLDIGNLGKQQRKMLKKVTCPHIKEVYTEIGAEALLSIIVHILAQAPVYIDDFRINVNGLTDDSVRVMYKYMTGEDISDKELGRITMHGLTYMPFVYPDKLPSEIDGDKIDDIMSLYIHNNSSTYGLSIYTTAYSISLITGKLVRARLDKTLTDDERNAQIDKYVKHISHLLFGTVMESILTSDMEGVSVSDITAVMNDTSKDKDKITKVKNMIFGAMANLQTVFASAVLYDGFVANYALHSYDPDRFIDMDSSELEKLLLRPVLEMVGKKPIDIDENGEDASAPAFNLDRPYLESILKQLFDHVFKPSNFVDDDDKADHAETAKSFVITLATITLSLMDKEDIESITQ